ncbi:TetR/AcrR family transcriptional regulator [Streptomyces sp. NPDC059374]|uniref:TetR/AcrR family transcriptional regulator n=1 Tax=unclassified Streptomyces TaxID=2593676 RepID=UPI003669D1F0
MTTARIPASARARPAGLRERKKTKTRLAIRGAAHTLIAEQGYEATTVEQIAERAEVSPSTVLRYFPGKEDIVGTVDTGPALVAALRDRPADEPWTDSLRHVLRHATVTALEEDAQAVRLRAQLSVRVPAVRSRLLESVRGTGRMLAEAVTERPGPPPDPLTARVYATSLAAGLTETCLYWAERGFRDDLPGLLDRALDVAGDGVPAGNPRGARPLP